MNLVNNSFVTDALLPAVNSPNWINVYHLAKTQNKKVLLFWYPKDFSYVCPTELYALQEALPEFESRNTIVIAASCDTIEVHKAWLKTPKDKGGIEGITFPILSDSRRELSEHLDILDIHEEGDNVTYRATYLLDETGKVFYQSLQDMSLGRNIDEYKRIIDAYTMVQDKGELCPANWKKGDKTIKL